MSHTVDCGRVAAEQAVVAEDPEVAGLGDGDLGRLVGAVVVEVLVGLLLVAELLHQRVEVLVGVADAVERVLLLELRQELGQLGVVPLGELVGAVVGDGERHRGQVVAVEPPDGHLGHAELLGGLQPGVAGDHLTGAAGDDGLLPAEAAQAGRDVGDGRVVRRGLVGEQKSGRSGRSRPAG
jgi:hypothetical protein